MTKFKNRLDRLYGAFGTKSFTNSDAKRVLTKDEKISDCNINRGVIEKAVVLGVLIKIGIGTYKFIKERTL